jgi:hypothetical protein
MRQYLPLLFLLLSQGCSFQAYDPERPEEYTKYWADEKNREESILRFFIDEKEEEDTRSYRRIDD